VPDVAEELSRVQQARARLGMRVTRLIASEIDRLEQLRSRPVLASATWLVDSRAEELSRYVGRSTELIERLIDRSLSAVADLRGQLRALSPQRTLDRGCAIAQLQDGAVLRRAEDAPAGTPLLLTLAKGAVSTTVEPAQAPMIGRR
jgi:exodeoxyribonuclease VII large subunit